MRFQLAWPPSFVLVLLLAVAAANRSGATLPAQLSKGAECSAAGFPDTSQYQSYVEVPGTAHFLPVYSSVDLTKPLRVSWSACTAGRCPQPPGCCWGGQWWRVGSAVT
jgi:hypothetical protein